MNLTGKKFEKPHDCFLCPMGVNPLCFIIRRPLLLTLAQGNYSIFCKQTNNTV